MKPAIKCDSCTRHYFSEYEAVMCAIDDAHTELHGYRDTPRLERLQTLREKLDKLDYLLKTNPERLIHGISSTPPLEPVVSRCLPSNHGAQCFVYEHNLCVTPESEECS